MSANSEFVYLIILILFVSWVGLKKRLLSLSGALAAVVTGIIISYGFGWEGLVILGLFFSSSSGWSIFKKREKQAVDAILAKNSVRDWQQVLANGGAGILFSLLYLLTNEVVWFFAFGASVAAANSDTWASEIGPLSKKMPVSVKTFRRVPKGTSGAVSFLGTIAAIIGALFISVFFLVMEESTTVYLFCLITFAGFLGNIVDTLIGAFFQLEYECKKCLLKTESSTHCGLPAKKVKGYFGINNEFVNFCSSLFAGFFFSFMYILI